MPISISYSNIDSDFALNLTQQIFRKGGHVWIDQCEIVPGESIYEKVQEAFSSASVIIAILTPESLQSFWCKKEVATAMTREIEERRVLLIPVLLRDCEIPLFLKDKKYADFREDFDRGMSELMPAIEKYGVPNAGRIEAGSGDFTNDYSYEVNVENCRLTMRFLLFQHSQKMPISIFSDISFQFNQEASAEWMQLHKRGYDAFAEMTLVDWACKHAANEDWLVILESPAPVSKKWVIEDSKTDFKCNLTFTCRRLGDETGQATMVRGHSEFEKIIDLMKTRVRPAQ
ncbi:MAG: toll/interleukin-1 receptor domain-containing protein [Opitutaceae bacterium]